MCDVIDMDRVDTSLVEPNHFWAGAGVFGLGPGFLGWGRGFWAEAAG